MPALVFPPTPAAGDIHDENGRKWRRSSKGVWEAYPLTAGSAPGTPDAPTLVEATTTTLEVEVDAVSGATGYKWYLDTVFVASTSDPTYTFTGLTENTEYDITVSATNAYGESAQSAALVESTESSVTLLLDAYDTNIHAAYSVSRKLRAAYSGAAIRVRESGGDTEADIGFTSGGLLDTAALLAHVGSNDGFIRTIYDQSGNGRNLVNTTNAEQPRIALAGVVDTGADGNPAAVFVDGRTLSASNSVSLPISYFAVLTNTSTTNNTTLLCGSGNITTALLAVSDAGGSFRINSGSPVLGPAYAVNTYDVVRAHFSSGDDSVGRNAAAATAGAAGNNAPTQWRMGRTTAGAAFKINEWVCYAEDVGGDLGATPTTGNDAIVINNMNAFYNIFTP
jgi:hypothetical protein